MFPPAPNPNTPAADQEGSGVQIEQVALKGWRWVLSWIVGNSLASSPSLPLFLMVMVGDFLATMSLCIPYTFLPAVAVAKGIGAQDAAFLISAAGISSTVGSICFYFKDDDIAQVGRVVAGLLCDQRRLHPMTITLMATAGASL